MKINKQKLTDLLVAKTGMKKKEVEEQLEKLIDRIIDAAERGKALEIKEFGMFYFDEEGLLKFDPSEELSTEINFKYAGMEPVELKPARKTALPKVEEGDDPLDDIFGLDSEEVPDRKIAAADSSKKKGPEEVETGEEDSFSGLLEDASAKLKESEEEEKPAPVKGKEPGKEVKSKPVKTGTVSKKSIKVDKKKKKRDPVVLVIVIFIGVILAAGAYFIIAEMDDASLQAEDSMVSAEAETESEPEELPAIVPEMEMEQELSGEVEGEDTQPEAAAEADEPDAVYGLMGDVVEAANDGFSIVLHSLNSEESARAVAADLISDGYRVLVGSRVVGDETVWRVSVGQFPSIDEAIETAAELPTPYNEQNFIHRIQIN